MGKRQPLLARRVKMAREKLGVSQRVLSAAAGLGPVAVQMIESQERPDPRISSIAALALALGCTIDALVFGDKRPATPRRLSA